MPPPPFQPQVPKNNMQSMLQGPFSTPQQIIQQNSTLMQNAPFKPTQFQTMTRGALLNFHYLYWKHDPSPLLLVTDVFPDKIRGINVHYLSFIHMRNLLQQFCGKMVSYAFIKHDLNLVNSFRTYKRSGMSQLRILDCQLINTQLRGGKVYTPQEIKSVRENIKEQLRRSINPNAEQMAKQYIDVLGQGQQQQSVTQPQQGMFSPGTPNQTSVQGSPEQQGTDINSFNII